MLVITNGLLLPTSQPLPRTAHIPVAMHTMVQVITTWFRQASAANGNLRSEQVAVVQDTPKSNAIHVQVDVVKHMPQRRLRTLAVGLLCPSRDLYRGGALTDSVGNDWLARVYAKLS